MKKMMLLSGAIVCMLIMGGMTSISAYSSDMPVQDTDYTLSNLLSDDILQKIENKATDWYYKPNDYDELIGWYQNLESLYPNYIEVFKANEMYNTGIVTGGYDLYYVRITNESLGFHKPEVFFVGGPHGDETVGTIGMYWFLDWLMRKAFTDEPSPDYSKEWLRWLIDNREIYFEVSHNPYGFDHGPQRYDGNYWDLNREADYDGPGTPTGGIWASVNGQTLRRFVDNHTIRVACDFHGGVRMLLYPWADTHSDVTGISQVTGESYAHAPPDFYFYDVAGLRVGDYMGDYGGDFDQDNVGPIRALLWYSIKGGIANWAYGGDVITNPVEDPYVQDEIFGNYPGASIMWLSPEMSVTKDPGEYTFGNDTVEGYGPEIRRYNLHQIDLAQPYVSWMPASVGNHATVLAEMPIQFKWQVNGSLVVDHTYIQYGTDPDPTTNWQYATTDHDEYAGQYFGGTGWEGAETGQTYGVTYDESIIIDTPGEYYFTVATQVDQVYSTVLRPDIYGNNPYLRMVKERTNDSYYEVLVGTDGVEELFGQTWWYSPIIHLTVIPENDPPNTPEKPDGPGRGQPGTTYLYSTSAEDINGDQVFYMWDWGDGNFSNWIGPYSSGDEISTTHSWDEKGTYAVRVKAKDVWNGESSWSEPLDVTMPKSNGITIVDIIEFLETTFPRLFALFAIFIELIT